MFQKLNFQLTSDCPMLQHNGQTADPLNKFAKDLKRVSSKRGKTDADFEEMARIEWYASVYVNQSERIVIPSEVLEAALVNGAKKKKLGKQAQAGLFVEDHVLLKFNGCDLTLDELWERDENRFSARVRVQSSRVMRTRFIARNWQGTATLVYDDASFNQPEIEEIMGITGNAIGVGDWRPKFGRFTPKLLE